MKFAYTIVYVADVSATLDFYRRAFGFATRFVTDDAQFGELDTGGTALAFARHDVAASSLPQGYRPLDADAQPAGIEVGFTTSDVPAAFDHAVAAGATPITAPLTKPWGQTVAYVRAPEGTLIELCTPMG
ncbi:VOC family protein [Niveibacterium sp. 24ML]|uniref:VOC family protein n=1 Tax=Niveibacterium sp. 24ML TaxID=2985512 RepID=UPI00226F468B|nr:VOC family protein [Niveibacterium sp. 24ML]MCX9157349.1 VOC family protein [Niveibacterium sp. 24ML]